MQEQNCLLLAQTQCLFSAAEPEQIGRRSLRKRGLANEKTDKTEDSITFYSRVDELSKLKTSYKNWSVAEEKLLAAFLKQNWDSFGCSENRRAHKIFLKMSELFDRRTSKECKSHYQYLAEQQKASKSPDVLSYLEKKILNMENPELRIHKHKNQISVLVNIDLMSLW